MKKAIVGVLACALAVAFVACPLVGVNSRHGPSWESSTIVRVEGPDGLAAGNMSLGYMRWVTSPAEGNPGALLVRDGDLLWIKVKLQEKGADKGGEFTVPWRTDDGSNLALKVDGPRLLMGDKTVSLNLEVSSDLESEGEGWAWLANASKEDLAALRFVHVDGAIPDEFCSLFANLARANPHVGLSLPDSAVLLRVAALDPRFLVLGQDSGPATQSDLDALGKRNAIETLLFSVENKDLNLHGLATLPNLRRLTLVKYESAKPVLPDLPCLESLTFLNGNLQDLTPLKPLTGLRELNFTLGKVVRLNGIEALPQLREVGVYCGGKDEKEPADCAPLDTLKQLRWLAFAPASQEQFARAIQTHPDLQMLEILGCDRLKNIAPLATLRELKALVLVQDEHEDLISIKPLKQMKQLRLLVLPKKMFKEKPGDVSELRGELPGCVIAEGEPFCLGAGRILLLVPLVAFGWLIISGRRSRAACRAPYPAHS